MALKNKIIALDGHDGSGKTTLAKDLAEHIGGIYIRPFGGEAGEMLIGLAEQKKYEELCAFGKEKLNSICTGYQNKVLVCDRHWMTVFSLLPQEYWNDPGWLPLPPTALCYAALETTLSRLSERSEKAYDRDYHSYYLDLYLRLAQLFNAKVLRTDHYNYKDSLAQLADWYAST